MDTKTWIAIWAFAITPTGGIAAGVDWVAKDADLQLVEYRLDQKIQNDQIYDIQQQIWQLEDRYTNTDPVTWPVYDRDRYRNLQLRLDTLKGGK